jgi:arylsulfatase A-like enzyme
MALLCCVSLPALAQNTDKPNILVIWGDDIGVHNISAYNRGLMGYQTPNIDRIGTEGAVFIDAYGQQSCTAGRASFALGEHPFRTGLLTIGMPGSPQGIPDWAPTIGDLLKEQGYMTGQFGKNHLGDRDQHLPTNHGFDEFFGNLYHLNAEEEPETYYYPKDPEFHKQFAPRGVIHSYADGNIEDTGPMTRKRMETADEEFLSAALDFIDARRPADSPVSSVPPHRYRPPSATDRSPRMPRSVVLPAPDAPAIHTISPGAAWNDTPLSTSMRPVRPLKDFVNAEASSPIMTALRRRCRTVPPARLHRASRTPDPPLRNETDGRNPRR